MTNRKNIKVVIVNAKTPGGSNTEKDATDRFVDSLKFILTHTATRLLSDYSLEIELCTTSEEAEIWARETGDDGRIRIVYINSELVDEAHSLQIRYTAIKVFLLAASWELTRLRQGAATILDMLRDPGYNAETILG